MDVEVRRSWGNSYNTSIEDLNNVMEFGRVIKVCHDRNGKVFVEPQPHKNAPDINEGDEKMPELFAPWRLMTGYSGQHGYSGPCMHASEFIGGGMARDIMENPGLYVAVVVTPDEGEPENWVVAYIHDPE